MNWENESPFKMRRLNRNSFGMFETDLSSGHVLRVIRDKKRKQKKIEVIQNADREHTQHSVHRREPSVNRCGAKHLERASLICRVSSEFWSAAAAPSQTDFHSQRTGEFPVRCRTSHRCCRHWKCPQRLSVPFLRFSQRTPV